MSEEQQDREFIDAVRRDLDRTAEGLDAGIQSRLTQARYAALEQKSAPRAWFAGWSWKPATALAATACLALALSFTLNHAPVSEKGPGLEDMEVLTANDQLELYEDLEFYAWLAEEESAESYEKG